MLTKLRHWWQVLRASFWFIPAVMVLGAVALAIILIAVEAMVDLQGVKRWPLLFGTGAAGARGAGVSRRGVAGQPSLPPRLTALARCPGDAPGRGFIAG